MGESPMKLMNFFALNLLGNGEHCAHWWRRHGARKNMVKPIGMPNRNLGEGRRGSKYRNEEGGRSIENEGVPARVEERTDGTNGGKSGGRVKNLTEAVDVTMLVDMTRLTADAHKGNR